MTGTDKAVIALAAYAAPVIVLGLWLGTWSVLVGVLAGTAVTVALALIFGRKR